MKKKLAQQLVKIANFLEKIGTNGGFGDNVAALLIQKFGDKLSQAEIGKYAEMGAESLAKYLASLDNAKADSVTTLFVEGVKRKSLKEDWIPAPLKDLIQQIKKKKGSLEEESKTEEIVKRKVDEQMKGVQEGIQKALDQF